MTYKTRYPGGKNAAYQHIINQIPPHRVYIEGFLGSGAIMRLKLPAVINIGLDLDAGVLPFSIAENADGCRLSAAITENGDTAVSLGMAMAAGAPTVMNGDVGLKSKLASIANSGDTSCKYIFIHGDAMELLSSFSFQGDEFVYLDPPYLMSARKGKRDLYRYEFGSHDEHLSLVSLIRTLPCMVAISGYWSDLYHKMLDGWRVVTFQAHTRQGMATEYLWMNYPEPTMLHDYRYLGSNFRERERIKRKAKRWVKRFCELDSLQRHAIISELNAAGAIVNYGGVVEGETCLQ
jgi:DNA adenine methylase